LVIIALFSGLIFFPLIGKITNRGASNIDVFRLREKRNPSQYPPLPVTVENISSFPSVYEEAFNDNLPFRELFIKFNSDILLKIFNSSPHKQLLIGKNNHCFLASHANGTNDLIFSSIEITEQRILEISQYLKDKKSFLEDLNVPVIMLSIPTSPLLDFSNIPYGIQKEIDLSFLKKPPMQRVIDNMPQEYSQKYLLFPYERILKANDEYPLFPSKNFHWSISRYTKLTASCIAEKFGIEPYEKPRLDEFEIQKTVSDLSNFAGTKIYNKNDLVYKEGVWEKLNISDMNIADVYNRCPEYPCKYTVNPDKVGKLLLVGDSYTPFLRFDLARHFGEIVSVNFNMSRHNPNTELWMKCLFEDIKPDYIVFIAHNVFLVYPEFIETYYSILKPKI